MIKCFWDQGSPSDNITKSQFLILQISNMYKPTFSYVMITSIYYNSIVLIMIILSKRCTFVNNCINNVTMILIKIALVCSAYDILLVSQ